MSDINTKRNRVKSVYPTVTWSQKVDKMSDQQVIAVFFRFIQSGQI